MGIGKLGLEREPNSMAVLGEESKLDGEIGRERVKSIEIGM